MAFQIDTEHLRRLRDRLLRAGARPSLVPGQSIADAVSDDLRRASLRRVAPFAELMFLMMVSDRETLETERQALRGAFRILTGDRLRSASLQGLLAQFESALEEEGRDARLEAICAQLALDPEDAEAGFSLAAAISLADGELRPEEQQLLHQLAHWLRLADERADVLLQSAHPR